MAKIPHDALHHLFRDDPALFSKSMSKALGIEFPKVRQVSSVDTDLTEVENIERRADTILLADTVDGPHLIVIEPQTSPCQEKRRSWAWYIAYLLNKFEMQVTLLVLTPKEETARWARKPYGIGLEELPTMTIQPIVIGPSNVRPLRSVEAAQENVAYSVFTTLVRRNEGDAEQNLTVLAEALNGIDVETAVFWARRTEGGLGEGCARQIWRKIMDTMTYPYVTEIERKGELKGELKGVLKGEAKLVLRAIERRGIELSEADRARIMSCEDVELLELWFDRTYDATSAEEVFGTR
ncbi:hypothetical protein GCM10029992_20140 [Glycomyces albus]